MPSEAPEVQPQDIGPLEILYQDDAIVAINKPSGMLVHRTRMDKHGGPVALQTLRDQLGEKVWPVHRLDKPTSGLLLFAKSAEVAHTMSEAFAGRDVFKTYLAVVRGWPESPGEIDYPLSIIRDRTTDPNAPRAKGGPKQQVQDEPQPAVTRYEVLGTCELDHAVGRYATARYALLRVSPETGRQNQIRRHFKHIFHPIVGDRKFGDRDHNAFFRSELGVGRLLLAATELAFAHPVSGAAVTIRCPSGFSALIERMFAFNADGATSLDAQSE